MKQYIKPEMQIIKIDTGLILSNVSVPIDNNESVFEGEYFAPSPSDIEDSWW